MQKFCFSCKRKLPFKNFSKLVSGKFGLYPYCKTCHRKKAKENYKKHREKRILAVKAYYQINSEEIKKKNREYYYANREEKKQKQREYNNREEIKKQHKIYRELNREKIREFDRQYRKNPKKIIRTQAKRLADKLNIRLKECSACGSTNNLERHHPDYTRPHKIVILCRDCHREWHINNKPIYP
jgi:hypothetical protein